MRKDAKIGFAIGGVLLAVLTVYVLVVPGKHKTIANSGGVNLVTPCGDRRLRRRSRLRRAQATSTDNQATADKPGPDKADPVASYGASWDKIFPNQTGGPVPLMTTNPGPGEADATAQQTAQQTSATHPDQVAQGTPAPSDPPVLMNAGGPATPATQPTAVAGRIYTIKPGQTLSSIAAEVYGNQRFYVAIIRANPTLNPNRLRAGTKITLPDISEVKPESTAVANEPTALAAANTYKVESGDTLYGISKKLFGSPKEADTIYDLNKDAIGPDKAKLKLGIVLKLPAGPTASTATATASTR